MVVRLVIPKKKNNVPSRYFTHFFYSSEEVNAHFVEENAP